MDKTFYPDGTGKEIIGYNVSQKDRDQIRRERNNKALDESSKPIESMFNMNIPGEKGGL